MNIAIIDYQLSNLFSIKHVCDFIGVNAKITSDSSDIINADAAILPGVGAYGSAMKNLHKLDLVDVIHNFVNSGKPLMGICLGMQLLFSKSAEFGNHKGLDIIKGKVVRFPKGVKVPQIGWNRIYKNKQFNPWSRSPFRHLSDAEFMYFVHSYYVSPQDKKIILSLTEYCGIEYCSAITYHNVFATQFHPEKSAEKGIKIYRNWINHLSKPK